LKVHAILAVGRLDLEAEMPELIGRWNSFTVERAEEILDLIWEESLVMGIQAYAALGRSFEARPDETPVSYDDVWDSAKKILKSDNDATMTFRNAIRNMGPIHALRENAKMSIRFAVLPLVGDVDALEKLMDIAGSHFTLGLAVEFAYIHCIAEKKQLNTAMIKLLESASGKPVDISLKGIEQAIRDTFIDFDNVHPWPNDGICLCGQNLAPFIFCCDPHRPINTPSHQYGGVSG
jgi:hypothetical protein